MKLGIGRKLAVGSTALLLATQVAAVPVVLNQQVKQSQKAQAAVITETIADAVAWIVVEGEKIPIYAEVIGASETPVAATEALTVAEAGLPALAGGPLAFAIGGTLVAAALGVSYVANADVINGYIASQISKGTAFGKALLDKAAEIMATVGKGAKLAIDKLGNLVVGISKKLLDSARDNLPKTRKEIDKGGWRMATAKDFEDGNYYKTHYSADRKQWTWQPGHNDTRYFDEYRPFIIYKERTYNYETNSYSYSWSKYTRPMLYGSYDKVKDRTYVAFPLSYSVVPVDNLDKLVESKGGVYYPGKMPFFTSDDSDEFDFAAMTPADRYKLAQFYGKTLNGIGVLAGTEAGIKKALAWFEKEMPVSTKSDEDKKKAQTTIEDVSPEPDVDKNLDHVETAGKLSVPLDLLKMPEYHVTENGTKRVINYNPKTKHWAYTETGKEVDPDTAVKKSDKSVVTAPKKVNWSTTTALTDSTGRPFDQTDFEPKFKPNADTSTQADTDNEILKKPEELPQTQADEDETIHWRKLQGLGVEFEKVFPFCIPFDLADFLAGSVDGLDREKMPELTIPIYKGQMMHIKMPDELYGYVHFIRTIFLLIFDISLCYCVYKWFSALK
ncbi:hypothetical protein ACIA4D_08755 [Lactobacillus delbrueckii subsp. bulgaricus]